MAKQSQRPLRGALVVGGLIVFALICPSTALAQSAIAGGFGAATGLLWGNTHTDPGTRTGKVGVNYRF